MRRYIVRKPMSFVDNFGHLMYLSEYHQASSLQIEAELHDAAVIEVKQSYEEAVSDVSVEVLGYEVYEDFTDNTALLMILYRHSVTLISTTSKTEFNRYKLSNPEFIFEVVDV